MNNNHAPSQANTLTLFLMTEKGFRFLTAIPVEQRAIIEMVVVGNDRSLQKDYEEEIISFCTSVGLPWIRRSQFDEVRSKYAMSISWRWLIRHPAEQLIVFHDSLLPKYRGFAPLVNALINGETEVGVTAIFGASEFDTGDIIAQASTKLSYPIKIQDAITLVNDCYLEAGLTVLQSISHKQSIPATPQRNEDATYSVWRDEMDYQIDWSQSAAEIRRLVDAVGYPYKGACTMLDGDTVRVNEVVEIDDVKIENRHCGKVLFVKDGQPVVICGQGMLQILDASVEKDGESLPFFPIKKFRMRFA